MNSLSVAMKKQRDKERRQQMSDPNKNVIIGEDGAGGHITSNPFDALTNAVEKLNGLIGDVELVAGNNITITPSEQTLIIEVKGGGGGVACWEYGLITESAGSALDEDWGGLS